LALLGERGQRFIGGVMNRQNILIFILANITFLFIAPDFVVASGTIKGRIIFNEKVPPPKEFAFAKFPNESYCKQNPNKSSDGKKRLLKQVEVDNNQGLKNAIVAVRDIVDKTWMAQFKKTPAQKVTAKLCQFFPYTGIAVQKGKFKVTNFDSDPDDPKAREGVIHNPHAFDVLGEKSTTLFNVGLPTKGSSLEKILKLRMARNGGVVRLQCDQHEYMENWFLPVSNKHYATSKTNGTFEINDVPVGKHKLLVWHPTVAKSTMGKTALEIEVDVKEGQEVFYEVDVATKQSKSISSESRPTNSSQDQGPRYYNVWFQDKGISELNPTILEQGKTFKLLFNIGDAISHGISKTVSKDLLATQEKEDSLLNLDILFYCSICRNKSQHKPLLFNNAKDTEVISFSVEPTTIVEETSLRISIMYKNFQFDELDLKIKVVPSDNYHPSDTLESASKSPHANKQETLQKESGLNAQVMAETTPRSLSIHLKEGKEGLYDLMLFSENTRLLEFKTNLTINNQTKMLKGLRSLLSKIRHKKLGNGNDLTAEEIKTLRFTKEHFDFIMASFAGIGNWFFETLFPTEENRKAWRTAVGNQSSLVVYISTPSQIFIPWNFLYDKTYLLMTDPLKAKYDKNGFWGYKYILDIYPGGPRTTVRSKEKKNASDLLLATFSEESKKEEFQKSKYIKLRNRHLSFFNQIFPEQSKWMDVRDENTLFNTLKTHNDLDVIYFFAHGDDAALAEWKTNIRGEEDRIFQVDAREPLIILTPPPSQQPAISPRHIMQLANNDAVFLKNAPLIFLNACETGEDYSFGADSFVASLFHLGARGIVVTEDKVLMKFAAQFGTRFLTEYLKNKSPIGKILLKLRRDYMDRFFNPFGFLYSYYGDSQLRFPD